MQTKGLFAVELVLWLVLILPGLCYSFWRMTSKYKTCPTCESSDIIPTTSPRGQKLLRENAHKT